MLLSLTTAVLLFCLVSCSNDNMIVSEQVHILSTISRATVNSETTAPLPDGTTIRMMLYQPGTRNYYRSGMYRYSTGKNYLEAVSIDESGNVIADPLKGINGIVGTYGMIAISPGSEMVTFNEGTERTSAAIITCPNHKDSNGNDDGAVWATLWEQHILGEYDIIRMNSSQEEIRSKVRFEIRKDPNLEGDIKNIQLKLKGAGTGTTDEQLYYYPQLRQCAVPSGVEDVMPFSVSEEPDTDGSTFYKSKTKYILSGIYAPKEVAAKILGTTFENPNLLDKTYLTLSMDFQQGNRAVSAEMMLNADADAVLAELKPQREYVYKILVASTYINIKLDIYDQTHNWNNPTNNGTIDIGGADKTFNIGTFTINNWKDPSNNDEQEI